MTDHILELSALAPEHPKALLRTEANPDGTLYELAVPEDFGSVGLRLIGRRVEEMDALWEREKLSKAQESRLELLLNQLAGQLIREVPREAIAALPAIQKRTLAIRFFVEMGEAVTRVSRSILDSSSPASNASTEATPAVGQT